MKKNGKKIISIIVMFVVMIGMCSCSRRGEIVGNTEYRNRIVAREFDYNGHHYIEFGRVGRTHSIGSFVYEGGVVHDPNCPCHNKE